MGIDPEMALAWSALSCAYAFDGDHTKARASVMKARDLVHRVNEMERRWIALDAIWVDTGDAAQYLEAMQEYIRDFLDDRRGYFYAGLADVLLMKDPAGGMPWFEQSYRLTPNHYPVTNLLADCYLALGQQQEAVQVLERYKAMPFVSDHGRQQVTLKLGELRIGS